MSPPHPVPVHPAGPGVVTESTGQPAGSRGTGTWLSPFVCVGGGTQRCHRPRCQGCPAGRGHGATGSPQTGTGLSPAVRGDGETLFAPPSPPRHQATARDRSCSRGPVRWGDRGRRGPTPPRESQGGWGSPQGGRRGGRGGRAVCVKTPPGSNEGGQALSEGGGRGAITYRRFPPGQPGRSAGGLRPRPGPEPGPTAGPGRAVPRYPGNSPDPKMAAQAAASRRGSAHARGCARPFPPPRFLPLPRRKRWRGGGGRAGVSGSGSAAAAEEGGGRWGRGCL